MRERNMTGWQKHQRLHSKKVISAVAVCLCLLGVVSLLWLSKNHSNTQPALTPQNQTTPSPVALKSSETTIHLAMMGDMLAHDSVNAQAKTQTGYDYSQYFTHIKPLYNTADIVFCNPETPVAGDSLGVSGYPVFNAPGAFAKDLRDKAGCNVINLATNHMNDKGQKGIDTTLEIWKNTQPYAYHGANSSGEEQSKVSYFTVKGIKVAFVAFMDFSNTPLPHPYSVNSYHNTALVTQLLAEAKKNARIVIVSAHWGTEDSNTVNADQTAAAQLFADNGATLIIGTGPHVEQSVAWLKTADGRSVPVWYSIGNMLSSQLGINGLTSGVGACDIVTQDSGVTVKNLSFAPTFMSYDWPAADKAVGRLLSRTNLQLRPLRDADASIKTMFGASYSAEERRLYLEKVLDASSAGVTLR